MTMILRIKGNHPECVALRKKLEQHISEECVVEKSDDFVKYDFELTKETQSRGENKKVKSKIEELI